MNAIKRCLAGLLVLLAVLFTSAAGSVSAQVKTRTEEIEEARRERRARLWPERESPLVGQVNKLVERGLLEGASSGKGANGAQLVLGGMRSGQGMSIGVGYRRTDIWRNRIGYRGTARGTFQLAYMLDYELDFQELRTERTFVNIYSKLESSPQMDYYGQGQDSEESNRTSYLLDDISLDLNVGYEIFNEFNLGATAGLYSAITGSGKRSGVPSTEEIFNPINTPGLGEETDYFRWGAFATYDYRDIPGGPRSGGFYGVRFRRYSDEQKAEFSFEQLELQLQQFVPYFNKTRVVAVRVFTLLSFTDLGERVPFYLQAKLGGNETLRGFARYRFYDNNMIVASVEHRWHAFAGLDMALFVDAGKVTRKKEDIDFSDLDYSAGIGFRFKLRDAVVMRIDFAGSREGFRFMWTFSDIFKVRWHSL
jgi:outer membrane protein assembly factor BamA